MKGFYNLTKLQEHTTSTMLNLINGGASFQASWGRGTDSQILSGINTDEDRIRATKLQKGAMNVGF